MAVDFEVEDSELTVLFDPLRYLSPAAAFADGHTTTTDGYDNDIDNRYQNDPTKTKKLEGILGRLRYFSPQENAQFIAQRPETTKDSWWEQ